MRIDIEFGKRKKFYKLFVTRSEYLTKDTNNDTFFSEIDSFFKTRKTPGFARLCSGSRFRFVGEICFVYITVNSQQIVPVIYQYITAKTGECYEIKRFLLENLCARVSHSYSYAGF